MFSVRYFNELNDLKMVILKVEMVAGSNWATRTVKIQLMDVNDNPPILPDTDITQCFARQPESLQKVKI